MNFLFPLFRWHSSADKGCARLAPGLANISNSIPSGFTVGTAEVSVPLVETLKTSISSIVNLAIGAATAMQVLMIIGTVAAGLTALGSGACTSLAPNTRLAGMGMNLMWSVGSFRSSSCPISTLCPVQPRRLSDCREHAANACHRRHDRHCLRIIHH